MRGSSVVDVRGSCVIGVTRALKSSLVMIMMAAPRRTNVSVKCHGVSAVAGANVLDGGRRRPMRDGLAVIDQLKLGSDRSVIGGWKLGLRLGRAEGLRTARRLPGATLSRCTVGNATARKARTMEVGRESWNAIYAKGPEPVREYRISKEMVSGKGRAESADVTYRVLYRR